MAKGIAAWGIEVGQSALKALKLRLAGEDIEAVDFAVIEHDKLLSDPDADAIKLTRAALRKLSEEHDLGLRRLGQKLVQRPAFVHLKVRHDEVAQARGVHKFGDRVPKQRVHLPQAGLHHREAQVHDENQCC